MIENMSIYYFPQDREKKYKGSMDEEDNARSLYNIFPTKDFKVIFLFFFFFNTLVPFCRWGYKKICSN